MKYLTILSIAAIFACSACTLTPEQKAKAAATGDWLLQKATTVAFNTILSAAQNAADGDKKADFLDGVAQGFRSNQSSLVTGNDVKELVAIWAPDKSQWKELGNQLADVYDKAHGPPDAKAETVAVALNNAAASQRKQDTGVTK